MVAPRAMWTAGNLTGNKRVRKGWWGKIILQVEVEQTYFSRPTSLLDYDRTTRVQTRRVWRDATAADVGLETANLPAAL